MSDYEALQAGRVTPAHIVAVILSVLVLIGSIVYAMTERDECAKKGGVLVAAYASPTPICIPRKDTK